jgi:hypothetical protein
MRRTLTTAVSLVALCALPLGDTITKTDGKVLKDVSIVEEGLTQTTYKKGNNQQMVGSEEVLSIAYSRKPRLVDEGDQAMIDDDPFGALQAFDLFADGQITKRDTRDRWAGPYAAWRSIQICQLLDDVAGVVERCNRLIEHFPDSRFVPPAYLARAEAQARGKGGDSAAQKSLQELVALVGAKTLSKRWELDANLGLILTDAALSADAKRARLEQVATQAGTQFPTVASRAQVAIGETFVAQIDGAKEDQKLALAQDARKAFQRIVADQKADPATLAAAYTGLGTAQFQESALAKNAELSREAFMNFMRVIVLYKEQSRYVAQSMFYAMLCLRGFEDAESVLRSREMRFKLIQRYPESNWAKQAQAR